MLEKLLQNSDLIVTLKANLYKLGFLFEFDFMQLATRSQSVFYTQFLILFFAVYFYNVGVYQKKTSLLTKFESDFRPVHQALTLCILASFWFFII